MVGMDKRRGKRRRADFDPHRAVHRRDSPPRMGRFPAPSAPSGTPTTPSFPTIFCIAGGVRLRLRRTGWQGHHLRLEDADGALLGAVPCYLKSHSQGEYVFDHGWADAFERAGGQLLSQAAGRRALHAGHRPAPAGHAATPTRPRHGRAGGRAEAGDRRSSASPRCMSPSPQDGDWRRWRAPASCTAPTSSSISSTRATRPTTISWRRWPRASARRCSKERREALADGITIDWLTGSDLTEAVWDEFFAFYMDTGGRKWGRPYLNREVLLADRRAHGRRHPAGHGQARRALHRRRHQLHRLRHALTAATGAASRSIPSCISRSATIRRSTSRSQRG